jgi:hypothetical protein
MGGPGSSLGVCRLAGVLAGAALLLSAVGTATSTPAGDSAPEYEVKAAFIANFAKFVEWPTARVPAPGSALILAILGDDPFGGSLSEAVGSKLVAGHPLEVRHVTNARDAAGAHVVFIAESERPRLPSILRELQQAPVLTVGDSDGYGAAGVIINLYVDRRRVRFEVNQAAAARAGLRLSAQLLAIARPAAGGA